MPFREKKAWATILVLVLVFTPYSFLMMHAYHRPDPNYYQLGHLVLWALFSFVFLELLMIFIARRLSPEDAGTPLDEREQLFASRATRIAYVTLIALMIVVTFCVIHDNGHNWGWGMAYLLAIVLAEIVRAAMLIVQYRRG